MQQNINTSRGFTLIELMIVVAVVAILAAIAYPSYQDSVRKSRRANAIASLNELQNFMERFYTENGRYDEDTGGIAVSLPYNVSPQDGTTFYNITLSTLNEQDYVLTATAISDQVNDKCGNLTLSNTGRKGVSSSTVGECW